MGHTFRVAQCELEGFGWTWSSSGVSDCAFPISLNVFGIVAVVLDSLKPRHHGKVPYPRRGSYVHTDQFNLLEHPHLWCQLDMLCEILHDINIYIFGGFVYVSCYIERGKNVETYQIYIYTLVKNNYNKYYDNILLYIIIILYYYIIL